MKQKFKKFKEATEKVWSFINFKKAKKVKIGPLDEEIKVSKNSKINVLEETKGNLKVKMSKKDKFKEKKSLEKQSKSEKLPYEEKMSSPIRFSN